MADGSQLSSAGNTHRTVLLSTEYPLGRRETSHPSPWTSESKGRSYEVRKGRYVGRGTLNPLFLGRQDSLPSSHLWVCSKIWALLYFNKKQT